MYYIIYRTINTLNNKEYIGQHTTNTLCDSYLGSGLLLKQAIKKYGKKYFTREVLFSYDNFDDMNNKEIELVNQSYISRGDTYNIALGGSGNLALGKLSVIDLSTGFTKQINSSDFDTSIHKSVTSGKRTVVNRSTCTFESISCDDFDGRLYKHPMEGLVVAINLCTGYTEKVRAELIDGIKYKHVNSDMITVKSKSDLSYKRISISDFNSNRELYTTSNEGLVTVLDSITGTNVRITKDEYKLLNADSRFKQLQSLKFDIMLDGKVLHKFWGTRKNFKEKFPMINDKMFYKEVVKLGKPYRGNKVTRAMARENITNTDNSYIGCYVSF